MSYKEEMMWSKGQAEARDRRIKASKDKCDELTKILTNQTNDHPFNADSARQIRLDTIIERIKEAAKTVNHIIIHVIHNQNKMGLSVEHKERLVSLGFDVVFVESDEHNYPHYRISWDKKDQSSDSAIGERSEQEE